MSDTAKGFFNSVPEAPGRFTGSFSIDGIFYNVFGSFSSSVPEFTCSNAKLSYNDIGDLTSTRAFAGRVGDTDIMLAFDNGSTITGQLNTPTGHPSIVSGSALWTQN